MKEKRFKLKGKKETKELAFIFVVLGILIALLVAILVNTIKNKNICYEYYYKEQFGISDNCFYDNDAYCEIDGTKTKVDLYYEKE